MVNAVGAPVPPALETSASFAEALTQRRLLQAPEAAPRIAKSRWRGAGLVQCELLVYGRFSVQRPLHGVGQLPVGSLFEDVTGSPRHYSLEEVVKVPVGANDEHTHLRLLRLNSASSLQAVHLGHAHVHQY